MSKKLLSLALALVMSLSLCVPAFAMENHHQNEISFTSSENVSDEELIEKMQDMHLSQEQISYIMQLEYNRRSQTNRPNITTRSLSSPEIGDVNYETYRIHFSTMEITLFGILGALVGGGVGAGIALTLANAIFNEKSENMDKTGVEITVKYIYGYTNDGVLGWITGPATYTWITD